MDGHLKPPQLGKLLGSEITSQQRVKRPLGNGNFMVGPLSHSGMVVETKKPVGGTNKWLVHKGPDFGGKGGQTVVTPANGMSGRWKNVGSQKQGGGSTVSDFVRQGGKNYNWRKDNCHDAVKRMASGKKK